MICLNFIIFSIVITARTKWQPLPTRLQMTAMYEQRKQTRPTRLPVTHGAVWRAKTNTSACHTPRPTCMSSFGIYQINNSNFIGKQYLLSTICLNSSRPIDGPTSSCIDLTLQYSENKLARGAHSHRPVCTARTTRRCMNSENKQSVCLPTHSRRIADDGDTGRDVWTAKTNRSACPVTEYAEIRDNLLDGQAKTNII